MRSRRTPRTTVPSKQNHVAPQPAAGRAAASGSHVPGDRPARADQSADSRGTARSISRELAGGFERLERLLQKQIEQTVEEARLRLTRFVRNELRNQIAECIRATLHKNIYEEIADQIHARLRAEMEERLDAIAAERTHLEPGKLLAAFTERASELIEQSKDIKRSAKLKLTEDQVQQIIRRAVLEALRSRRLHLTHLVELDRLAKDGMLEHIPDLLPEWFVRAGLERVDDPEAHRDRFEQIGKGKGPSLEVVEPAYIDVQTGQTIRSGRVRWTDGPLPEQQPTMTESTSGE